MDHDAFRGHADHPTQGSAAMTILREVMARRVVAIIRTQNHDSTPDLAAALIEGGITALEITVQNDAAYAAISQVRSAASADVIVGAGTILNESQAARALDSGASFFVSPHLDPGMFAAMAERETAIIPGVATPTEVQAAAALGCTLVKLFPAGPLGTAYLEALRGPFPEMGFMVTGGIEIDDVHAWIRAGAAAVGLGGRLLHAEPGTDAATTVHARARQLIEDLAQPRGN